MLDPPSDFAPDDFESLLLSDLVSDLVSDFGLGLGRRVGRGARGLSASRAFLRDSDG